MRRSRRETIRIACSVCSRRATRLRTESATRVFRCERAGVSKFDVWSDARLISRIVEVSEAPKSDKKCFRLSREVLGSRSPPYQRTGSDLGAPPAGGADGSNGGPMSTTSSFRMTLSPGWIVVTVEFNVRLPPGVATVSVPF